MDSDTPRRAANSLLVIDGLARIISGFQRKNVPDDCIKNVLVTWSGWPDSNRRFPAPKAGAITKLDHIPARIFFLFAIENARKDGMNRAKILKTPQNPS